MNSKLETKKVLIVTGSRGEYGYIRQVIKSMNESTILEPKILATNMHMLPEFGNTISQFVDDQIKVDHKIYMTLGGYTNTSMVKSLGVFMLSIADVLSNHAPDFILLAGDRGEQLVASIAGANMNIPIAHIQAGELSGNVDGTARHAISRFAHVHFAANEDAAQRLIKMGEESFRVFNVGAPQLDEFVNGCIAPPEEVADKFDLILTKPILIVVQHPVTEQFAQAAEQMRATLEAVMSFNEQTVIIYPNSDAGSLAVQETIKKNRKINIKTARNVPREIYAGLMNIASVIVGNSSSGLLEAPSFKLPAVNIGRRQEGRFQGENVINVKTHEKSAIIEGIKKGLSKYFKESLENMNNPYGDGKSSQRIVNILEEIRIDEKLLFKKIAY